MYRIHFDPKIGRFVIQVLVWGIFWKSLKKLTEKMDSVEVHSFQKLNEAMAHVSEIGLDKLYQNKSVNCYRDHMKQVPQQLPLHDAYTR